MRLGDLDQLMDQVVRKKVDWNNRKYMEGFNDCILRVRSMIHSAKTIDPESLPIVQELRAELERVKAERDAAVSDLKTICDCDYCEGGCVSTEEECCMFCEVEGCLCRGCIGGVNWTWRGLQKVDCKKEGDPDESAQETAGKRLP